MMKIDGSCLCGHVSYEAEIDPGGVMICHCTDCQTHSGTAFRYGVLVKKEDFRLVTGELKFYIKTSDGGSKRALGFCPECGTSIYGSDADQPKIYSLRLGTARQRGNFVPSLQIWQRSAVKWLNDIAAIKSVDKQPQLEK